MRRLLALAASLLLTLSLAACGDDDDDDAAVDDSATTEVASDEPGDTTVTAAVEADTTVSVADSDLGEILVDAEGMTLYLFTNDTATSSACEGGCATTWPPLVVDGEPGGGEGVDASLLGAIERPDGSMQVTYNGHPLYTYANDAEAGDTTGHGVGEVWFAVTPAGDAVAS